MSAVAEQVMAASRIMREAGRGALKDKSYRRFGVGEEAGRFLRSLRWAGHPETTRNTYETVYARLALDHADFDSLEGFCSPVGTEYLREFLERHWGDAERATRANRLAALRSLFKWAVEEGRASYNPVLPIKSPRRRDTLRQAHARADVRRLLASQDSLRDSVALALLARLGLRKNDLRLLRVRDLDLTRNLVVLLHGKGGKESLLPIEYPDLLEDLYLHIVGEGRHRDEYLLFPRGDRMRPMDPASVHRWFKRCLERAELPDFPMHELRHTAGDELWRATGNLVLAQQLLRHRSVETTRRYLHPTPEDLRAGMRVVRDQWQGDK